MKTQNNFILKNFLIITVLSLFIVGCSKKLNFSTSSIVPAAEGTVKYKKDNNNNYEITAKVMHLADPKKLSPSKDHYILWMETEQNGRKNLGQIESSTGWFSSARKATLKSVTPFKPTSFFITAENDVTVSYPGNMVVLKTN